MVKTIFGFIVEVKQAADYFMPRGLPVIALCDTGSPTNWISSKFVQDLERSVSTNLKLSSRSSARKGSEAPHIQIRWTCEKLGQYSTEGKFFIEPKAHFKILFGCGYESKPNILPTERISRFPSHYSSRKGKRIARDQDRSEQLADAFRRGVQDGTLLLLKRLPQSPEKRLLSVSLADLEAELDYMCAIDSLTDRALGSDFMDVDSPYFPPSAIDLREPIELASIHGSETDTDSHVYTESANTSCSDDPRGNYSLTSRLRVERGTYRPYSLENYLHQDICEEPHSFVSQMIQPRTTPFHFTRYRKLNSKQQQVLAAAKAAAEKTTREYWIWDDAAKNYKHYDEGNSEPVWYNPP